MNEAQKNRPLSANIRNYIAPTDAGSTALRFYYWDYIELEKFVIKTMHLLRSYALVKMSYIQNSFQIFWSLQITKIGWKSSCHAFRSTSDLVVLLFVFLVNTDPDTLGVLIFNSGFFTVCKRWLSKHELMLERVIMLENNVRILSMTHSRIRLDC